MVRSPSGRRGFTLVELLVAMALIVFLMSVLSEAFVAGLEAFRQLKAGGDMAEKLRTAAFRLRADVRATNLDANEFIADGLLTGKVDPKEADDLRERYDDIIADARILEAGLQEVELRTTDPVARRLMQKVIEALRGVREGAVKTVDLLDLIDPPVPGPR
jgi:prepilin-type N-terminal cleavage/methylation domain-containing protein